MFEVTLWPLLLILAALALVLVNGVFYGFQLRIIHKRSPFDRFRMNGRKLSRIRLIETLYKLGELVAQPGEKEVLRKHSSDYSSPSLR